MKRIYEAVFCLFVAVSFSGCSVFMAAHQPDYKDLSFLKPGVSRNDVIVQLGSPLLSEKNDAGNKVDYFKFRQGYGAVNKTARMLFHGTADVFTLGLWEVVATPGEAICNGHDVSIKIIYDQNDNVNQVLYLKEKS